MVQERLQRAANRLISKSGSAALLETPSCLIASGTKGDQSNSVRRDTSLAVIAGRAFLRGTGRRLTIENLIEAKDLIVTSGGQWLAKHVWGEYIIAIVDHSLQKLWLFRDPTGLATLYFARTKNHFVFCSNLVNLVSLLPEKPAFDHEFLSCYVLYGAHATNRTPFLGVKELRPGQFVEVSSAGLSEKTFWNPIALANSTESSTLYDSMHLRKDFFNTVGTCLANEGPVYIDLSGGLDSSALVAAARYQLPKSTTVIAGTVFHPSIASATELQYAREVASKFPIKLIELNGENLLPLSPATRPTRKWDRPSAQILHLRLHEEHAKIAEDHGCKTVANGYGGDQVFHAKLDRLHHLGDYLSVRGREFWSELRTGLRWGISIPRALAQTAFGYFNHYTRRSPDYISNSTSSWTTNELINLADRRLLLPSYWKQLRRLTPLKARQVLEIYDASAHADRGFRLAGLNMHHPFLAQPLVEIGLSLSVDKLIAEGIDRFAFRNAMCGLLPESVIKRCAKGEYSGMYQLGLRRNLHAIEVLLTEGWAIKNCLVRKSQLISELRSAAQGYSPNIWPLLNLISLELWFLSWE